MDKNKLLADYLERSVQIKRRTWSRKFRDEISLLERNDAARLDSTIPVDPTSPNRINNGFSFARAGLALHKSMDTHKIVSQEQITHFVRSGLSHLLKGYFVNPLVSLIVKDGLTEFPVIRDLQKRNLLDLDQPASWHAETSPEPPTHERDTPGFKVQNIAFFNYFKSKKANQLYPILCEFEAEIYWNFENYKIPVSDLDGSMSLIYRNSHTYAEKDRFTA